MSIDVAALNTAAETLATACEGLGTSIVIAALIVAMMEAKE